MKHLIILMYLLFTLFVGLKLTGHIDWSWWLVFAPLWGFALARFGVGFALGFAAAFDRQLQRRAQMRSENETRTIN